MSAPAEAIRCAACGRTYAPKPELAGRRVKCKCGAAIQVPAAPPPPPPDDDGPPDFDSLAYEEPAAAPAPRQPHPPVPAPAAAGVARPTAAAAPAAAKTKADDDHKWWYYVGGGLFLVVGAFLELSRLSDLDDGRVRSVRLHAVEAAIYAVLGKWGVFVTMFALGVLTAGLGVYQFIQERKQAGR
jgi:hypothetical protein